MIYYMNLHSEPFMKISSGTKTIEMRLNDERRKPMNPGDIIEFVNNETQEKLRVLVLKKHNFKNFFEVYQAFDKILLGYEKNEIAHPDDMQQYYDAERIEKCGVLGIEIKLLSHLTPKLLVDNGICPTCFNKEYDRVIYGDNSEQIIYEDEDFECLLVDKPRSDGHAIILTKAHYKDMMDIPDDLCQKAFVLSKKIMNVLKSIYRCESVYLCTMCDGPMNHFHLQFIPRYKHEERGSLNFVKVRKKYIHDAKIIKQIKDLLQ